MCVYAQMNIKNYEREKKWNELHNTHMCVFERERSNARIFEYGKWFAVPFNRKMKEPK